MPRLDEMKRRALPRIPNWVAFVLFASIALTFLWEEHKVHILGALPYLLLLACPLIHLLMHGGHGRHHDGHGDGGAWGGDDGQGNGRHDGRRR